MGKFKMRFKLAGLEFEVEGDRQDTNQLTNAISKQIGNVIAPIANIAATGGSDDGPIIELEPSAPRISSGKPKRKSSPRASSSKGVAEDALDWRHDTEAWGNPKQGWSTSNKSLWLLFVIQKQTEHKEVTAGILAASFNKHFRQAGTIRPSNVARDFGNFKTKKRPAWVSEDTTADPSKWFLTDEGFKQAEKLVVEAKGDEISS